MATAVVIGANRGIGLELCRGLARRGDTVVATCRATSIELESLGVRVETKVDVASDGDVEDLATRLGSLAIDILILNAGVLEGDSLGALDFDSIRRQLEINSLGPLRVAQALRKKLKRGSKIAIVTSRMGSMADNTSGGYYGYRMSKAALNAAGVSLARDLEAEGVAVAILHPGFVRTRMTEGQGQVDPEESARHLLARVDELSLDTTGQFRHMNGEALPW